MHTNFEEFGGKYRVLEKINQGGMSSVYRARNDGKDEIVALKELLPSLAENRQIVREFYKEAKLVAKFNHPNVIKVLEINKNKGIPYIVMEYVAGKNLKELIIKKDDFLKKNAMLIILGIARGLNYIHQYGVIHKDIKPENVLISDKGEAKITDFGLAKREKNARGLFRRQGIDGTLAYMSPEQIRGKSLDGRSDIYSFGITAYEVFTGRMPLAAPDRESLIKMRLDENNVVTAPSVYDKKISPELEGVILKMLQRRPELRYQSAAELLVDLEKIWRTFYE